jgi:hypothetical protein
MGIVVEIGSPGKNAHRRTMSYGAAALISSCKIAGHRHRDGPIWTEKATMPFSRACDGKATSFAPNNAVTNANTGIRISSVLLIALAITTPNHSDITRTA